jgi:hypothetical protein
VNIADITDVADIAMYIADIAMDIADIATDIADIVSIVNIVNRCRYYRLDIINIIVKTNRYIKGVIGVSCNKKLIYLTILLKAFCLNTIKKEYYTL